MRESLCYLHVLLLVCPIYLILSLSLSLSPLSQQLEPHRLGTPYRSPSRSPRAAAVNKKKGDYLLFLEQSVFLLLSEATRYLVDPSVEVHDKQVLKKELANELVSCLQGYVCMFSLLPSRGRGRERERCWNDSLIPLLLRTTFPLDY